MMLKQENTVKQIPLTKALHEKKKLEQRLHLGQIDGDTYEELAQPYKEIIDQNLKSFGISVTL